MSKIPFLHSSKQEEFLRERDLIDGAPLSSAEQAWLSHVNFHYLLGYARNYRELFRHGLVSKPKTLATLKGIIDAETEFLGFIAPWLRKAEWHLRSLAVQEFCIAQEHGEGYLDSTNWVPSRLGESEHLQRKMLDSIARHGEPYVTNYLKGAADLLDCEVPPRFSSEDEGLWFELTSGLPLWAIIDSFSIGTLGKFIMICGPQPQKPDFVGEAEPVWKLISNELGITKKHFSIAVDSFGVLRNSVFHHQRLWMRPMAKSPGIPNDLMRRYKNDGLKNRNKQAQFVVLAVVSRFLPHEERAIYLDALDVQLAKHPLFELGIKTSPFSKS